MEVLCGWTIGYYLFTSMSNFFPESQVKTFSKKLAGIPPFFNVIIQ